MSRKKSEKLGLRERTWKKFAWKTFLFHTWNSNDGYIKLMKDDRFTEQMWNSSPELEEPKYIAERIIKFLGSYGCHTPNSPAVVCGLVKAIENTACYLRELAEYTIENVDFDREVKTQGGGESKTVKDIVEHLYKKFDEIPRIGTTSTGKIMHVLQPKLFIMWDKGIRDNYSISENSIGYYRFLTRIKTRAKAIDSVFQGLYPDQRQTPATYLSQKFNIDPHKTLTKFIDEYNWMTITKSTTVPPPTWFPY